MATSQLPAPRPPRLEGYDVLRQLGRGGQGSVWLLARANGGGLLAAKCCAPDAAAAAARGPSRHNESELTREWRVLALIRHPHLLPVHGLLPDDSSGPARHVLLVDYVPGGSLRDLVALRGLLAVGECVTVLTPIAQVLSYLHGQGVSHGDVSPGNILLSAAGKPILADLGLAQLTGQPREPVRGTPGFSAPPVPGGAGAEPADDVYALAAVGWFALTGQPPPPTRERMPLSLYVPQVPHELLAALEAALADDPAQRPTAAAFAQAVFRSAPATGLDLADAVHPSVVPELETRARASRRHPRWRRERNPAERPARVRRAGVLARWGRWWRWRRLFRDDPGRAAGTRHAGRGAHRVVRRPLRRTRQRWLMLGGALLACGALLPTLWWPGGPADGWTPQAPTQAAARPAPTPPENAPGAAGGAADAAHPGVAAANPVQALQALARLRSTALVQRSADALAAVSAAASPARQADMATLARLRDSGHSFVGLATSLGAAAVLTPGAPAGSEGRAVVAAEVITSAYEERDAAGGLVHRQEQPERRRLLIELVRRDARWLIWQVRAAP